MTMPRVLEPEVMDSPEEARDYHEMDHAEVNRQFVDDLLATGDVGGDVLDLGTGTARIPVELCQRIDNCRVLAADLSVHMLDLARYNIEVHSLIERITLAHLDSKNLPHEDELFAIVMSNSIVHHIPEPIQALREAVRVVESGGLLFFRDLMRPEDAATVERLVEIHAAEATEHQRKMFDDSLRAALNLDEIGQLVEELGFSRETVTATSDRHWTWIARKP